MHLNIQNIQLDVAYIVTQREIYLIEKLMIQHKFFSLKLFYCTYLLPNYLI